MRTARRLAAVIAWHLESEDPENRLIVVTLLRAHVVKQSVLQDTFSKYRTRMAEGSETVAAT